MNDLTNNELNRDSHDGCISVDHLIDHAFTPNPDYAEHLNTCSTCQVIMEGIRHEIETLQKNNKPVNSDILKLNEQDKGDDLLKLLSGDDFYSELSEESGLSLSQENMIRKGIEAGSGKRTSSVFSNEGTAQSHGFFSLHTLTGRIAAGISVAIITATALLLVLKEGSSDQFRNVIAIEDQQDQVVGKNDGYDRYELRIPVSNIKTQKDLIEEIKDPYRKSHSLEAILDKKAVSERLKSTQMNPFLLRITDLNEDTVLFQQAVSHPPRELYDSKLKGEWNDSTRYRIDYFLIRNMELIDSLNKED